jgi:hypothetical protein
MTSFKNQEVKKKFDTYPDVMKEKLLKLRELIYEVADNEPSITKIEETLKWNEPAYLTNNGSTLRMDWKEAKPEYYSLYVNCQTKLIKTLRELFSDRFTFEGNREIVFHQDDEIDCEALKYCILLTLTYHDRKHLPMLDT